MITPSDVITIILFFIPGYISIYVINIIVGFNIPKDKIEKVITYILHSSISIIIYKTILFFFTKEITSYTIDDLFYVLLISPFWGMIYGFTIKFIDKKGWLPYGLVMSNNMFRKFHRDWFRGRWVRVKLKSGDIYKGWLCTYEDDYESNIHYVGLADVNKLNQKYKVIKKLGYSVMLINLNDVETIEYYSKNFFKDNIKNYQKK